jgi:hypothetical protein
MKVAYALVCCLEGRYENLDGLKRIVTVAFR